jgi:hypothetical protein
VLINVAAQHFFKTTPQRLGRAAILSIFAPIFADLIDQMVLFNLSKRAIPNADA